MSNNDTTNLNRGQCLAYDEHIQRSHIRFSRAISRRFREEVLGGNDFTCQMCGVAPGEIDPETNRQVMLHIGHIKDKALGGKDDLSNLRGLCSTCKQGAKNITSEKPTVIWLLSQIRRAGLDEQKAVYDRLRSKFGDSAK